MNMVVHHSQLEVMESDCEMVYVYLMDGLKFVTKLI